VCLAFPNRNVEELAAFRGSRSLWVYDLGLDGHANGMDTFDATSVTGFAAEKRSMRALLADDHVIFRQGLRALIESIDRSASFLEADSFASALEVSAGCDDLTIIIADLRMPGTDSFAGLRALRKRFPSVPVLVLSASEDAEDVFRALEAGASGYLAKSAPTETLVEALRLVLVGGVYVPRSLIAVRDLSTPSRSDERRRGPLTLRQREVLALIAAGHSNKEIAAHLGVSEGTIKAHVSAIMRVLGVRNRVQLLLAVTERGITTEGR
jgi:DNA-binding NarL/FixJ family response regulator